MSGAHHPLVRSLVGLTCFSALLLLSSAPRAQQNGTLDAEAIRAAIERALGVAPRGYRALQAPSQTGVRVLGVDVQRLSGDAQRVTIDLSQRALTYDPSGSVEALLDQIVTSTAALTAPSRHVAYRFEVDGVPLEQFVPAPSARGAIRPQAAAPRGPVLISAGHGWYRDIYGGGWHLQRGYYWGIVEDFVNWDIAFGVLQEFRAANIDVRGARYPDSDTTPGVTGEPQWQDGATYHVRGLGTPPEIWDIGVDDYARDINTRPFYANYLDASAIISIHNNGGGGTGSEAWFDETNGQQAESQRLAQILNDRIVAAIRARYNPDWPDRGLRSCNGCKGENRLATRPAVILEIAFMDMKVPDNAALHDETFKAIVAQAIREGYQAWLSGGGPILTTTR